MKTPTPLLPCLLATCFVSFTLSAAEPLRVAVSTPDVASLARQIGGEDVRVFCFRPDPVEGLKASRLICDKLVALRPGSKANFDARHAQFVKAWANAYFGETLAARANLGTLEDFESADALEAELAALVKRAAPNDGIAGMLAPFRGTAIVGDHDLWPCFARRYGLDVLGYLEPSPGVPPTTRHLGELIGKMKEAKVRVILTAPYFDQRHGRFVSERTGAKVVPMAHQTGGRPGTSEYLDMVVYNATQLANALKDTR